MIRTWLERYLKFKMITRLMSGRMRYLAVPMLAVAGYRMITQRRGRYS